MHIETVIWNTAFMRVGVSGKEGNECLLSICYGAGTACDVSLRVLFWLSNSQVEHER